MQFQDYYKILGVKRNASADEIKTNYRRLARKYHPDVSKEANAEEEFKKVQEAYEVLKDPKKRQSYDQLGSQWKHGQGFNPQDSAAWQQYARAAGRQQGAHAAAGDFSDFFEAIFGAGFGGARHTRQQAQRGQDIRGEVQVTLEEAFHGTTRTLSLQRQSSQQLNVKIPAGVSEGQQIRLAKQGAPGIAGGVNGDVLLTVHVLPHRIYTLDGRNVQLKLPIMPWEAALGAQIEVPTLGGTIKLNIPAGSKGGRTLRLKGRGLPGKPAGDQLVTLNIEAPEPANDEQRELYQKMQLLMNVNPRKNLL